MRFFLSLIVLSFFVVSCATQEKTKPVKSNVSKKTRAAKSKKEKESLSRRFLEESGLKLAKHSLADKSGEGCLSGAVNLVEVDKALNLMVGGRLLLNGIKKGKNKFSFSERDCRYDFVVNWQKNKIISREHRVCKKDVVDVTKFIKFDSGKFNYVIKSVINKKKSPDIRCYLSRSL